MNASKSVILPLLFLVPVLLTLMTSQPLALVMASDNGNDNANIPDTSGQGQQIQTQDDDDDDEEDGQGPTQTPGGQPQCITAPCPTEPNGGPGGGLPQIPSGRNLAEANQLAGIGSGNIQQRAEGAVNEQYCSTIAGIGDRRCAQFATEGADNIQDCTAIAGLGKANCVQSENPDGSGTCLTANGRPYICNTATGTAISGSGQAGQ